MDSKFQRILFLLAFSKTLVIAQNDWTYGTGPTGLENWPISCAAFEQSPVDLNRNEAEYMGEIRAVVQINSVTPMPSPPKFNIANDGRILFLDIPRNTWTVTLNSDAPDRYEVYQIIYHWGSNSSIGSEHRINGKFHSLEMQIVAYDKVLYTSPDSAKSSANGLAITSVLFAVSNTAGDLKMQSTLLETLKNVQIAGTSNEMDYFDPQVLLPTNQKLFFRYYGSLTTPPCRENVQWTVLEDTLAVSEDELKLFRELKNTDGSSMQNNVRPIQSLNPLEIAQPRVLYTMWNSAKYLQFSSILLILTYMIAAI